MMWVRTQGEEQELCREWRQKVRWEKPHKYNSGHSSLTHMLTLAPRWYLKIRSMTKLFHCQSPFMGLQLVKVHLHATPPPQPPPPAVSGHLLWASRSSKHFVSTHLFTSYNDLMTLVRSSPQCYRWENWGRESFVLVWFLKKTVT